MDRGQRHIWAIGYFLLPDQEFEQFASFTAYVR